MRLSVLRFLPTLLFACPLASAASAGPAPDTLRVRGYWGPFHRTQTWRRPGEGGESRPGGGGHSPEGRP